MSMDAGRSKLNLTTEPSKVLVQNSPKPSEISNFRCDSVANLSVPGRFHRYRRNLRRSKGGTHNNSRDRSAKERERLKSPKYSKNSHNKNLKKRLASNCKPKIFNHTEINYDIYSKADKGLGHGKELHLINKALELENFAHDEFLKILKIFRDLDFAHGKALEMLVRYKFDELKRNEGKFGG